MLSNMQDASEDFRARSLAIPGQEARFGNRSLDNRGSRAASEEGPVSGPTEPKKRAVAEQSSDAKAVKTAARATRSKKEKEAVPETSDLDVKMGQYADDLIILLRKIKLARSLDEGSSSQE
jgi:hypothetical protein